MVTAITDDTDTVTVTLTATPTTSEDGGSITYTATLTNADGLPVADHNGLTVNLANQQQITIQAGATSGTVDLAIDRDDVWVENGDTVSNSITGVTGGSEFENLTFSQDAVVTNITDDSDTVTVTLTATPTTSEDGGSITYTATLANVDGLPIANHNGLTVTLANQQQITIQAGATSGTVDLAIDRDDVWVENGDTVSNSITGVTGGSEFENLTFSQDAVVTNITDDSDTVTVTLTATPTTSEDGGSITYTATLSNVDGLPIANHNGLTVTLDNQQQITIQAGATSGTVDLAIDRDDVWVENGDTVSNSITGVTGGSEFESLTFSPDEVVTAITDDTDIVTVTLTATPTTSEDGGSITYTATLTNADGLPVAGHNGLTVNLANQQQITIQAGATSGTVDLAIDRDDVWVENRDTVSNSITGVTGGSEFENLTFTSEEVVTAITDDQDEVTITLTATPTTSEDGGSITYTATLSNVDGLPVANHNGLTVTLANQQQITIQAGATSGTVDLAIDRDDVWVENGDTVSNSITGVTGGSEFENLTFTSDDVVTTITDDNDPVIITLTATPNPVIEGGVITYTATLSNADGLPVDGHDGVSVDLANGQTITIAANSVSGTVNYIVPDDKLVEAGETITNRITGVSPVTPNQFEQLLGDTAEVTISITDNDFAPTNISGAVSVSEEGLSNGILDDDGQPLNPGEPGDTTNNASVTGKVTFDDPDGVLADMSVGWDFDPVTFLLNNPPAIESGGSPITWTVNSADTSQLIGSIGTGSNTETVMVVTLDPVTAGSAPGTQDFEAGYTVTLSKPVDHPLNSVEDISQLDFGIKVTDGSNTTDGTLTVKVEDDMPVGGDVVQDIVIPPVHTNLTIIIDRSGSMDDPSGVIDPNDTNQGQYTRFALAKQTVNKLVDEYANYGNVMVKLVMFESVAFSPQNVWVDAATAKAFINGLDDLYGDGGTDFDDALEEAKAAFLQSGKFVPDTDTVVNNVSYFLSDGVPWSAGDDIDGPEETAWINFLADPQGDQSQPPINSIAIGLGTGLSKDDINPVAYNAQDNNPATRNTDGIIIDDLNLLSDEVEKTISIPPTNANLIGVLQQNGETSGFGADGGYVKSFTVTIDDNGTDKDVIYTFDGNQITNDHNSDVIAGNELSVLTSENSRLKVNMSTGEYTFAPSSKAADLTSEEFSFTLIDNDGDGSEGTLTIRVVPEAPVAEDFTIQNVNTGLSGSVGFEPHVTDYDGNDDDLIIQLTSLPESGWLYHTDASGTVKVTDEMLRGGADQQNFTQSGLHYEADPMLPRIAIIGDTGSAERTEFTSWGISGEGQSSGSLNIGDGQFIELQASAGHVFGIVDPDNNQRGGGLGIISEYNTDGTPSSPDINKPDERITASFIGLIAKSVTLTVDGLGSYYDWMNDDGTDKQGVERVEIKVFDKSGTLIDPATLIVSVDGPDNWSKEGGSIFVTNNEYAPDNLARIVDITTTVAGQTIDSIEFGIEGAVEGTDARTGSFELRNIQLNSGLDDSFNYVAIDADDFVSNEATVTVDTSGYLFKPQVGNNTEDALTGDSGVNNRLSGLDGNDTLTGAELVDVLIGGRGSDTLTGGDGKDYFVWDSGDIVSGTPQSDNVTDFALAGNTDGQAADALDLRNLLKDLLDSGNSLEDLIQIAVDASGTTISFTDSSLADLTITLDGQDLQKWDDSNYTVTVDGSNQVTNESEVLTALINNGQLLV
ncbi:hypothetical protein EHSB41UT_04288 [Parendozoicomonas haliclonae]|uniref:VWFA domain-containing protein n=1 Tax=Parendozoicomonas haliclonae TaxID=1960125 RepID=A0A1X7AST8_9GAMM|nr:hypothetical protein EHSB41UT_04288 [Parendozoicomonas haliclonae]